MYLFIVDKTIIDNDNKYKINKTLTLLWKKIWKNLPCPIQIVTYFLICNKIALF